MPVSRSRCQRLAQSPRCTLAFGLLKKGVDRLTAINGARTVYDSDPLQSMLLDITAISTHIIVSEQAAMVPYGRWMMERAGSV